MPTPKLHTSTGISGLKAIRPQQPVDHDQLPEPPATAPITTPVSLLSFSNSPSPLAISEIATASSSRSLKVPAPRHQQTTTSPQKSGLHRAGHFLARGSGTAEDPPPSNKTFSRPESNKMITNVTSSNTTIASTAVIAGRLKMPPNIAGGGGEVGGVAGRATSAGNNSAVAKTALRAPRSISGIASRASNLPAPMRASSASAIPTPTAG